MTEPVEAQATRSFEQYVHGAIYSLDPSDDRLMSLLGAGYFSAAINPNLTRTRFDYQAGEVVPAGFSGNRESMAKQDSITPEDGYQPDYSKVDVPEKKTGTERATTADEPQENEATRDGEVGTEQAGDSEDGQRSSSRARKSSGSRNR